MQAEVFEIIEKVRAQVFDLTDLKDFKLQAAGQVPADTILSRPEITLYALDFDQRLAVFVETPADVDLSQAPFFFVTQYEAAVRVLTISFDTLLKLAEAVPVDDRRLIILHSTGRSGSTLASQVFAQIPGIINISEPDVLTLLVAARVTGVDSDANLMALLKASMALQCKDQAETAWVVKGRSYIMTIGDWLHTLYPGAKHLFLYRDAETWMQSCLNAYLGDATLTDAERRASENGLRGFKALMFPDIAAIDPNQHLSYAEFMSIEWLSVMSQYEQIGRSGGKMLAIPYTHWRTAPRQTAEAMLDYCQVRPADMRLIYETLKKDSQAGTALSQTAIRQRKRGLTPQDLAILNQHLQAHPFIHTADFEPANMLKV